MPTPWLIHALHMSLDTEHGFTDGQIVDVGTHLFDDPHLLISGDDGERPGIADTIGGIAGGSFTAKKGSFRAIADPRMGDADDGVSRSRIRGLNLLHFDGVRSDEDDSLGLHF